MAHLDQICEQVLVICQSYQQIQQVDVDLIKNFSQIMLKSTQIDLSYIITSKRYSDIILLFSNIISTIDSQELNKELVNFLTTILNKVSMRYRRLP